MLHCYINNYFNKMFKIGKNAKTNTNNFKKEVVMVLVLFLIAVFIIIMLIFTTIIFSTIRITIKDLKISTTNMDNTKNKSTNAENNIQNNIKYQTIDNTVYKDVENKCKSNKHKSNYLIIFSLHFLNRIKFLSIKFDRRKIEKLITKMHLEKVDIQKLEREIKLSDIREVINIKPKLSYLNLNLKVGMEDVLVTTYIVPILCTVFTLILPRVTKKENVNDIKYVVEPIYNNGNILHLKLESNIELKIINILNCIFRIYRNKKNEICAKSEIRKNKIKCSV